MMRTLVSVLWLFSASMAYPQSSANPKLEQDVRTALAAAGFSKEAITVTSRDGTVVLHGEVRDAREKLRAIEAAFSVPAAREVETALELRNAVTPEVEEAIWFAVMQQGLDAGVDQILVENGIARIDAPAIGGDRRDQLKNLVIGIKGVRSVSFEVPPVVAAAPAVPPEPPPVVAEEPAVPQEPPPVTERAVEEVAEPEEPLPPTETAAPEPPAIEQPEAQPEAAESAPEPEAVEPEPEPAATETPQPPDVEQPAMPSETPEPEPEPALTVTSEPPAIEPKEETATVARSESTPPPEPPETDASEPDGEPQTPEPGPLPSPGASLTPSPVSPGDMELLGRNIVEQILTDPNYTVFDHIQLGFGEGVVRLTGFVTEASKKEEIGDRVASVAGDHRVENEIRVLMASTSDEALRQRLFERIYNHPTFAAFAKSKNPPVHIIVEAGGVRLTGVVDRQIDATVAETIALNTFGVRRVESRLRVATPPPSP